MSLQASFLQQQKKKKEKKRKKERLGCELHESERSHFYTCFCVIKHKLCLLFFNYIIILVYKYPQMFHRSVGMANKGRSHGTRFIHTKMYFIYGHRGYSTCQNRLSAQLRMVFAENTTCIIIIQGPGMFSRYSNYTTGWLTEKSWYHFWHGQENGSRLAPGPTYSLIQWVLGVIFPRVKQPGYEDDLSPTYSAQVKKASNCPSTLPSIFME
jgi:hypothetical protein